MKWPWQRTPEKRQSTQPFTDAIQAAIAAQAGGNLVGRPAGPGGAWKWPAGAYAAGLCGRFSQLRPCSERSPRPSGPSIARSL